MSEIITTVDTYIHDTIPGSTDVLVEIRRKLSFGLGALCIMLSVGLLSAACDGHLLTLTGINRQPVLVWSQDILAVEAETAGNGDFSLLTLRVIEQKTIGGGRSDFWGRSHEKVVSGPKQLLVREPPAQIYDLLKNGPPDDKDE